MFTYDATHAVFECSYAFHDGHNHHHNMNRAIEQLTDNDRYVASVCLIIFFFFGNDYVQLAYNNTVAIWDKVAPTVIPDAHAFPKFTRLVIVVSMFIVLSLLNVIIVVVVAVVAVTRRVIAVVVA